MINILLKAIGRLALIFLLGVMASLMASALMDIRYFFKYRTDTEFVIHSFRIWMIAGGVIGIGAGVASNLLMLRGISPPRDLSLISQVILRTLILFISTIWLTATIWFFYTVDYFPLKDKGPIALIVGVIFSGWDLSNRIAQNLKGRQPSA